MGGRSSRVKGHGYERKIATLFRKFFPNAKRGFQTRGGTAEAPDVDGTPFYIECKRQKNNCSLPAALKQAEAGQYVVTDEGTTRRDLRPPVAICKNDRERDMVAMYLDDFMKLVERIYGEEKH